MMLDNGKLLGAAVRLVAAHREWQVEYELESKRADDDQDEPDMLLNIDIYGRNATPQDINDALDAVDLEVIWQGDIRQPSGEFVYTRQCIMKERNLLDAALERFLLRNRSLAIASYCPTPDTMLIEVMHGEGLTQVMLDHTYFELGRAGFSITSIKHHPDAQLGGLSTRTECLVKAFDPTDFRLNLPE